MYCYRQCTPNIRRKLAQHLPITAEDSSIQMANLNMLLSTMFSALHSYKQLLLPSPEDPLHNGIYVIQDHQTSMSNIFRLSYHYHHLFFLLFSFFSYLLYILSCSLSYRTISSTFNHQQTSFPGTTCDVIRKRERRTVTFGLFVYFIWIIISLLYIYQESFTLLHTFNYIFIIRNFLEHCSESLVVSTSLSGALQFTVCIRNITVCILHQEHYNLYFTSGTLHPGTLQFIFYIRSITSGIL